MLDSELIHTSMSFGRKHWSMDLEVLTVSEADIRSRLESLIDRWMKATPAERMLLIHEKIRLEEMLDQARQDKAAV